MRRIAPLILALILAGCRIETVQSDDTTRGGVEPGPGIASCGITPASRVTEDGLGIIRIGSPMEAIRGGCTVISEQNGSASTPGTARIDLGRDTALVELTGGLISRITLTHQAYRTSDSLGVGTHVSTLMRLRDAVGVTDRNRLYAVSPAVCGLRFMLEDPGATSAVSAEWPRCPAPSLWRDADAGPRSGRVHTKKVTQGRQSRRSLTPTL